MRGTPWSDCEALRAQELRSAGYGSTQIAKALSLAYGTPRTKNSVVGLLWRIQQEMKA